MGDPKLPRRAWRKPKRPLNYDLKMEELKTLGTFGLKTKRELWKAHTELSRIRNQARSLLALGQEIRHEKEPVLMRSLSRIGLVEESSTLDDVLNLKVTDLLSRRLQTIAMSKIGFKTPYQARQAIVHGHVMIADRVVTIPSYVVDVSEEQGIRLLPGSSLKETLEKLKEASEAQAADEAAVETGETPAAEVQPTGKTTPEAAPAGETPAAASKAAPAGETPAGKTAGETPATGEAAKS